MRASAVLAALFVPAGCVAAGCSCEDEGALEVNGEGGYVRCFADDAPDARSWEVGGRRLALDDERRLRIELDGTPTLVAFAGPIGPPHAVRAIRAAAPDVVLVLGDVEPSGLAELAALDAVVLVIAGGGDRHRALTEAFEALGERAGDRVLNASVLRSIRIGELELVPVAGAPEGRYALDIGGCGVSEGDLDAWDLGDPDDGVHRVLVSWMAPFGEGPGSVSRGLEGVEAGSPSLRALADRAGADAAIFAWPRTHAGRAEREGTWRARIAVGPLAGPAVVRADGTRASPRPTVLRVTGDGLSTSP